jgi:tetratricopeptide (TPR) repeat protein
MKPMDEKRRGRLPARAAAWLLAVVAAPLCVFWPALSLDFYWDDFDVIVSNDLIRGLGPLHLKGMFTSFFMTTWQPLGWLFYAVIYKTAGLSTTAFHAAALVVHALVCALLFLVLRRLLAVHARKDSERFDVPAACAALLFAVHPLQSSSASWPAEIPDMLATAGALLSALAYLNGRRRESCLWFLASGLCRWKAVGLPFAMIAIDLCAFRRRVAWKSYVPFFLVSAVIAAMNAAAKSSLYAPALRPGAIARGLLLFPWITVLPRKLLPMYSLEGAVDSLGISVAAAAALVACIGALLFVFRKKYPAAAGCFAAYAALALPPLCASQAGVTIAYPYHVYLALIPLYALAASGLDIAFKSKARILAAAAVALVLCVEAGLARADAILRADRIAYWTRAISFDRDCRGAYGHLARALAEAGRPADAVVYVAQQLRWNPRDADARENWRRLSVVPALGSAGVPGILDRIGGDLLRGGLPRNAFLNFSRAVQLAPRSPDVHEHLAVTLALLGRPAEAQAHRVLAARYRLVTPP